MPRSVGGKVPGEGATLNQAGGKKIDAGLYPEHAVFESDFVQCRPAGIDADEALDAGCRGKQIAQCFPEGRNGLFGP